MEVFSIYNLDIPIFGPSRTLDTQRGICVCMGFPYIFWIKEFFSCFLDFRYHRHLVFIPKSRNKSDIFLIYHLILILIKSIYDNLGLKKKE